ncbi:hematopoietic SH2 domain-containing protein homolog [Myxocyprinus asiaticus]|uniref:hematopoietic SH2 domain-containing protein homolog n=1 Tax=Myxocyprinus asiaticus TaxID=70543 RepID=UPI0022239CB7|nr:hematopoietic SH2 domain-containing protein homolog [Myxocyprinus asiaticus]
MIDMLSDNQYVIVGETMQYRSLHDLVAFHCRNHIMTFNQLLTLSCEQEQPTKSVPKPRTIHTSMTPTQDTPPPLPPRASLVSRPQPTMEEDRSDRQKIPPNTHGEDNGNNPTQQKHQQQLKPVMAQIEKKFKKKCSHSEDHTYEEIIMIYVKRMVHFWHWRAII